MCLVKEDVWKRLKEPIMNKEQGTVGFLFGAHRTREERTVIVSLPQLWTPLK
jgi:hypothetical protein